MEITFSFWCIVRMNTGRVHVPGNALLGSARACLLCKFARDCFCAPFVSLRAANVAAWRNVIRFPTIHYQAPPTHATEQKATVRSPKHCKFVTKFESPEGFRKCDDHFRQILPASRSTQLNWEILVPVPDDVFTIIGISLIGFANTILRSWNRVTVENVFWKTPIYSSPQAWQRRWNES